LWCFGATGSWRANSETGLHSHCAVCFLSVHPPARLVSSGIFIYYPSEEDTIKALFAVDWILEITEGNFLLPDDCASPVYCSFSRNRSNLAFHHGTDACVSSILYVFEAVSAGRRKEGRQSLHARIAQF
jgi:hypothetical protein